MNIKDRMSVAVESEWGVSVRMLAENIKPEVGIISNIRLL